MLSIKLTPFILFLLILVVLVISIIFGNWFSRKEGFISFAGNKRSLEKVSIPHYSTSKPVYKLDDNLFFDYTNGNLIELDAAALSGTTYDSTGVTIKNVLITSRNSGQTSVIAVDPAKPVDTELSKIRTVTKGKKYLKYPSQCKTTTQTYTIYTAWDDNTYISLFTKSTADVWSLTKNFYIDGAGAASAANPAATGNAFITGSVDDTDDNDDQMVIDELYSKTNKVYQLSKFVKFDPANGNLIIIENGAATIYDRNKTKIANTNLATSVPKVGFAPWNVLDNAGQKIVLYLANGQNTLVTLVEYSDNSKAALNLVNQKRFTQNGLDSDSVSRTTGSSVTSGSSSNKGSLDASGNKLSAGQTDSLISEYFKWYWYWKSSASSTDNNNDYILKTQIVPPVCPSCPGCAASTGGAASCTNCGGQGGSGTLTATGQSIFDASGNATSCDKLPLTAVVYDSNKKPLTCASFKTGVAASAAAAPGPSNASGASNATAAAAVGATLKDGASGVGGVINNAVNTVGGVATNVVGEVGNVAGDIVTTAGSIVNTAANNVTGLLKPSGQPGVSASASADPRTVGTDQSSTKQSGVQRNSYFGTQNQTVDQYSYNGQLPTKSASNYIPVTADFSAFGK
jgi:hypothetical protein